MCPHYILTCMAVMGTETLQCQRGVALILHIKHFVWRLKKIMLDGYNYIHIYIIKTQLLCVCVCVCLFVCPGALFTKHLYLNLNLN